MSSPRENLQDFPRFRRLRKKRDFVSLQRTSTRFTGAFLQIDYNASSLSSTRLGITVSKRYGKAHDRNRFKRLVREAFRKKRLVFSSAFDLNVLPKKGSTMRCLSDCALDFDRLIHVLFPK